MFLILLNRKTGHLNPMDYSIWDVFQQLVYRQKFKNINHLKQILNSCWGMISQKLINGCY